MTKKQVEKSRLEAAVEKINKVYGSGSIMNLGKNEIVEGIERIPFTIPSLDDILGGGLPKGRIIEIFGPESSSKTTLCLHAIAASQAEKKECAFIDSEHSLNLKYAENLGVDLHRLYLAQPNNGEEALDILETLLEADLGIIVIDSVAALTPKAEIDGDMGDSRMGLHARLMSQAMRKIVGKVKKSNTTVMFTNQLRKKIGVVFGNPEVTTGGEALKFYASIRLDLRSKAKEKDGDVVVGEWVRVKAVKNKVAVPHQECDVLLIYGEGYSFIQDIMDRAVEMDVLKRSGSWWSYDETKLGQGASKVRCLLKDNTELVKEIYDKIK
jgi:recombination protein RecA